MHNYSTNIKKEQGYCHEVGDFWFGFFSKKKKIAKCIRNSKLTTDVNDSDGMWKFWDWIFVIFSLDRVAIYTVKMIFY